MDLDEARALVASVTHWHHEFEIFPGLVTPGTYQPTFLLEKPSCRLISLVCAHSTSARQTASLRFSLPGAAHALLPSTTAARRTMAIISWNGSTPFRSNIIR